MPRSRMVFALLALVLLVLIASDVGTSIGAQRQGAQGPAYVPGQILLKFKADAPAHQKMSAKAEFGAQVRHVFKSKAESWNLGSGVTVEQAIQRLRANPNVEYAEPNYYVHMDIVPNDPRFPEMWGLRNTGQTGGVAGADIDAVLAWNVSTGSPNVVVGDIDTGCDYNHPDLAANIWTNPGEIPGNGIDDDGNGYVDDVHGYDFANNDGDPFDDNGHGTHTAGTIAAVGDNGIGVVGVGWSTKVMCIKFLDSGGSGTYEAATLAVDYSTNMGVALTSNSWGGSGFSQTLYDAVSRANVAGIPFVAAAGNNGTDNDVTPYYPTNFDQVNVISVAATDSSDLKASFSDWGATTVDLAAPGVDVLSTLPGNSYGLLSGTSMATPHVSGVLALMKAVAPNVPLAQLKAKLLSSVDPNAAMNGKCVSNGRLNAFFTIAAPDTVPPGAITDLATVDPGSNTMGLTWTATGDDGNVGTASYYEVRYSSAPIDDSNWASATRAGNEPTPQVAGSPESMEVHGLNTSTFYYFALKAFDEWGNAGPLSNLASGTTLPPPIGNVDPSSVPMVELLTGQQTDRTVMLSNIGPGTLDFTIPTPTVGEPYSVVPVPPLFVGKGEEDPRHGDPVLAGSGGPDTFGYRWIDSDEAGGPTFAWTDISGTGTAVPGVTSDDSNGGPVALGFNFPFYGTLFSSIRVCSNGWLSFTNATTAYSNQPLPNSGAPENLIAPFWDDLNPGGASLIFFQSFGTHAIVQWNAIPAYSGGGTYTFQAIIDQSGMITLQYLTMTGSLTSATVGIQDAAKTTGLQVAFNQAYIHDNLAVRIASIPQWLTAAPTSGRLRAGESKPIVLHYDAAGLSGGHYPGTVNIQTNDPAHLVLPVSAVLHVTGAPEAHVQPTSLAYGDVFVGVATPQTLIVANAGTDTLVVTDMLPSAPEIAVNPRVFSVAPHSSQNVTVTWTPSVPGAFSGSVTVQSNDSTNPNIAVPVTGNGLVAPQMVYDPTSFTRTLYTAQQEILPLTVYNTGGSNLIVNAAANQGNGELVVADEASALASGGPDGFGYRWKDSDASGGPTFNWVDISTTGTLLSLTGDDAGAVITNMGMTFPFYGSNFTSARVNTNGFITFDTTNTGNPYSNVALPNTTLPKNTIAPFWDDLYFKTAGTPSRTSKAFWQYDNANNRVIIQYKNVFQRGTTEDLNFEVLLYSNGKIVMQYQTMTGTLNIATVGMQNLQTTTPTNYLQMVNNGTYIKANFAILISKTPDWLTVTPASATIPAGGSTVFNVKFDATDRSGGVLNGGIVLTNNRPETKTVPCQLTIIGVPVASFVPTSIAYGTQYVGYSHLTTFQVVNTGTDVLNVTDVTTTHGSLTVEGSASGDVYAHAAFNLPPGSSRLFTLRWLPMVPMSLNAAVQVYSNDPVNPIKAMPVTGTAILPPIVGWSPTSFTESLISGDVVHRALRLTNTGGSNLTYSSDVHLTTGVVVPNYPPIELKKEEPDPRPGILGSGGPDTFGYRWRDSDSLNGPAFSWTDISGSGTLITFTGSDDATALNIPIGFSFPFYGGSFTTMNVCTNGWLSFTNTTAFLTNYALPSTSAPENLLALFWDDLHLRTGNVKYFSDGSRFIVQYTNVDTYSTSGLFTFQVILYPNGRIVYQYLSMTGTVTGATLGIQNAAKDDGLTVVFNAAYVHPNLAVEFSPPIGWLGVTPRTGTVAPGAFVDLDVAIDSTGLVGGDYTASVDVTTNDPLNGVFGVPVSLHVTGVPHIGSTPASLTFPMTYVGYSHTLPLLIQNTGTDILHVSGVSVSGDFSQTGLTTPVDIPVYGSIPVTVSFSPTADGTRTGSITIASDDPTGNPLVIPLDGLALIAPVIQVTPTSFTEALNVGDVVHRTLTVSNQGGSDLTFTAAVQTLNAASVTQYPFLDLKKGEPDPRPGILGSGGPDTFGYKWKDSDEPGGPVFDWVDISSVGTRIFSFTYSDDGNSGPLPIGFSFPYYGQNFTTFRACTNGWVSFTSSATVYSNSALPSSGAPENMLAALWDDLVYDEAIGSSAYYYYDGTRTVLQFNNIRYIGGSAPYYSYEVILYPSGRIVYQYLTLGTTINSNTVGIQNAAMNDGLTVAFNAAYLHNDMAIEFKKGVDWLAVSPAGATIPAGGSADLDVVFDATELVGGDYAGGIYLSSNDPARPLVTVPVSLHVTGIPDIGADPASLTFPMTYVGYSSTLPLTIQNNGNGVLHITDVTVAGDFSQTGLTNTTAIPPFSTLPITVHFSPTAPGTLTGSITITSDDPDESPFVIPLEGTSLLPPVIQPNPASIYVPVLPDTPGTTDLAVCNTGGSDLVWQSGTNIISGASVPHYNDPIDLGKDDPDPRVGVLGSGGPDGFGYRWTDSDEPGGPIFDWVDITGVGTPVSFTNYDDGNTAGIPLGFEFPFYGDTFATVNVCTNGWLSFTSTLNSLTNYALPSTSAPENLLAAFWDDLDLRSAGDVFYYSEPDGSRFILSFVGVPHYSSGGPYTFELILYPNGKIVYQYLDMQSTLLNSATIGIQNAYKDDGLTVVFNGTYVHNNMAVQFASIPQWLICSPVNGTVPAGECQATTCSLDCAGLDHGFHDAAIGLSSNDPANPLVSVPVRIACDQKPTAVAGEPQQQECTGNLSATFTLSGSGSDPDGDPLTFLWTAPGITFDDPTSPTPTASFPLGTTVVTLVVNDGYQNSDPATVTITVVDTIPPAISVVSDPSVLWPPNHRMVVVNNMVVATDICDPSPAIILTAATSNEPDNANGNGDGNTINDIQDAAIGTSDFQVLLRAERDGTGSGRVYTMTYVATDTAGNATGASSTVAVPHDMGSNSAEPLMLTLADRHNTRLEWIPVEGAQHYDVVRGDVANLQIQGSFIDLGQVVCIDRETTDNTTMGFEDTAVPAPGHVFFYVAQYFDGARESSYGTESAAKPRSVKISQGDCH
jgi:subtilisin family serine protease